MSALDLIFDWSQLIMDTFPKICDWFCTPISFAIKWPLDDYLGIGGPTVIEWICENIYGVPPTPIAILMGPGLTFYLLYTLIKWAVPILN